MKILILAAMDKEQSLLLSMLSHTKAKEHLGLSYHVGTIAGHEVAVAKCGIGKVNASLNAYRLIMVENPDLVINSGVAGGAGIPVGTLLVADKVAYDDVWCGPGTAYGQADGFPLFFEPSQDFLSKVKEKADDEKLDFGLICTGDKFISTPEEIGFIRENFPEAKAVDMESAAIAQTCFMLSVPFAIVRVVSDTPGEADNVSQYKNFWTEAPERTFRLVKEILETL